MYKFLLRPFLFLFYAEHIHALLAGLLQILAGNRLSKNAMKSYFCLKDSRLETEFCGLTFPNPIGMAAGFDKNAELVDALEMFGFGFIEIGTLTPRAQPGNPKPRVFRLLADNALINRMGFNNEGVDLAVEKLKRVKEKSGLIIGGNIGKNTDTPNEKAVEDYLYCFHALYDIVDYLVINISCPNIKNLDKLADRDQLHTILSQIQQHRASKRHYKPVLLKISPDLSYAAIDETLALMQACQIDGIIATNTSRSRENLTTNQETIKRVGDGGLSGKPLQDQSNKMIQYISDKTKGNMPIIGVGGVMSPQDAQEKLLAGATLVQVYSGWIYEGPALVKKINQFILNNLK